MRKRTGADISEMLEKISRRLDRKSGGALLQPRIAEAWRLVAGETVCSHTAGSYLRQGELVVEVDSAVWATELSALSEQYREAVNEKLGQPLVKSVRFSVSRKVGEKRRFKERQRQEDAEKTQDEVPSVPLSDAEFEQVRLSVENIPDQELREAVLRATVADLEWKKGIKAAKRRQERREAPQRP